MTSEPFSRLRLKVRIETFDDGRMIELLLIVCRWLGRALGLAHRDHAIDARAQLLELSQLESAGYGTLVRVVEIRHSTPKGCFAWIELLTSGEIMDGWIPGAPLDTDRYMVVKGSIGTGRRNGGKPVFYVADDRRDGPVVRQLSQSISLAARRSVLAAQSDAA